MSRLRYQTPRIAPGFGNKVENNRRAISVRFDEETFNQIRARALQRRTGFAEQVRALVERGLTAEEFAVQISAQRRRA